MAEPIVVSHVLMPEKGNFLVRCACTPPPGGSAVVVTLDYGPDIGTVTGTEDYDPAVHGPRVPGYMLVRPKTDDDDAQLAENEKRALTLRTAFAKVASATVPDLRVPYARLSFGKSRLFVRFVTEVVRPNLSRAISEFGRQFGVSVNAWQMGPRDEVSVVGALGPCGRVCCCASWQSRFPSHLSSVRCGGRNSSALNGTCGRFKCCLAFEEGSEE